MLHPAVNGVAIDLPGSGDSEPADCYCVPCTTETVARTIRSVTDEPVHLVGNSYGGTVSLRLAATHPRLVRSLTLISPAVPFLNPSRSSQFSHRLLARLRRGERDLIALDPEGLVREVLAQSCADPSAISRERITEFVEDARRAMATPWRWEAQGRRFRGMVWELVRSYLPGRGSLRRLARGITQRTLVLWGSRDRVLDFRLSAGLARLIPHGRFVLIDGAGHLPHLEAPRAVADALESFWRPW
jgi:pimeloyl-ACP methyl ester carboxylesterase